MQARKYVILHECVERGIQSGWARAHKHHDNPSPSQIQEAIEDAVMNQISEYFFFEDDE